MICHFHNNNHSRGMGNWRRYWSTGGAFYGIDSTIDVPFIMGNKGVENIV
jgi:hypothetical protein